MNFPAKTPAGSTAPQPPMFGVAADSSPHAADGAAAANLSRIGAATPPLLAEPSNLTGRAGAPSSPTLPAWADNEEARALLAVIAAQRPDRTRQISQTMCGTAAYGFAGKASNQLRQIYDRFFMERIDWCSSAGFGTPLYHKRRTAVLAYDAQHGPDALIAKVLA